MEFGFLLFLILYVLYDRALLSFFQAAAAAARKSRVTFFSTKNFWIFSFLGRFWVLFLVFSPEKLVIFSSKGTHTLTAACGYFGKPFSHLRAVIWILPSVALMVSWFVFISSSDFWFLQLLSPSPGKVHCSTGGARCTGSGKGVHEGTPPGDSRFVLCCSSF